ncbi:hypothetical protein MJO29_003897 [Puccinia striiformis f. sp. tritici]|nr:hypothetical protein MJO29_003897 [Puccinia striiformis f. sp. tritici]
MPSHFRLPPHHPQLGPGAENTGPSKPQLGQSATDHYRESIINLRSKPLVLSSSHLVVQPLRLPPSKIPIPRVSDAPVPKTPTLIVARQTSDLWSLFKSVIQSFTLPTRNELQRPR